MTYQLLIAGRRVPGRGPDRPVVNPYSGEVWAHVAEATPEQVDEAVAAARQAFEGGWAGVPGVERARLLGRLADIVEAHAGELGALETRDNGKLLRETTSQARFAARVYRYYGALAANLTGQVVPLEDPALVDHLSFEPYGVCALLIAWNSPMQLLSNKLGPALAAGNTAVVKPSEHASASVCRFADLVVEAGFPPGVVNVVTGEGASAGATLVGHPGVDLISLTGGSQAGRAVLESAALTMAKVVLELGGRSPQVVFDDADLDAAVGGVAKGIFAAGGQTCIAGSRLYVDEKIYPRFMGRLAEAASALRLGDPFDPGTDMGPMANRPQFERVLRYLEQARGAGIRALAGGGPLEGRGPGLFVAPTIYGEPPHDHPIACEEVFGPVLSAWPFRDEEEALGLANDSSLGLAAGVWTRDLGRAHRAARALRAGTVWVNTYRHSDPAAPFGGMKRSGVGRERGVEGLREYLQSKNVIMSLPPPLGVGSSGGG